MSNQGWICPKCKRVWGPSAQSCGVCNKTIGRDEESEPEPEEGLSRNPSLEGYGGHYGY